MTELRAFAVVVALTCNAACAGAGSLSLPVRVLSSEGASAPRPVRATDDSARAVPTAPRIGAPGGSGAGSRRVTPAQSGNDTVGGLPVGIGGNTGPAGRG